MRICTKSFPTSMICNFILIVIYGLATVALETELNSSNNGGKVSKVITVGKSGHVDFSNIQSAINSIPVNNKAWVRVQVKNGIYGEKVQIPVEKPFIVLEGESMKDTIIAWGDYGLHKNATFSVFADNFVARRISFYNTYNHPLNNGANKNPTHEAAATMVMGNRVSFYECGFYGLQDTLWDAVGLHYYKSCFIEGFADFIFGQARSIFEKCTISAIGDGYITAQGRDSGKNRSAFVFKECDVIGTGKAYLGRPWRCHSTVLFYNSKISNAVVPQGWDIWNCHGHEGDITYAEHGCYGPGSNMSKRVPWMKKLNNLTVSRMASLSFINKRGWIERQP
ncbi:hypothetical protein MKX01_013083 [Papaver californicum]|nr:hypothetical protein MKX01_013083 [Papaver californicum]